MLHPGLCLGLYGSLYCVNSAKLELHFPEFPSLYRPRSQEKLVQDLEKDINQQQQMLLLEDGYRVQVSLQLLPSWSLICQMDSSVGGAS